MKRGLTLLSAVTLSAGCTQATPGLQGGSITVGDLRVERAVVWTLVSAQSGSAGMLIHCSSTDTLLAVNLDGAKAQLHGVGGGGTMTPISQLPCPAGSSLQLRGQGDHIMLTDWTGVPSPGDTVTINLHWSRAGVLTLRAPVMSYSNAQLILQN